MRLAAALFAVLWGLCLSGAAAAQPGAVGPSFVSPGARCRFLTECSQFDSIGLHLGTSVSVLTDAARSVAAQGGLQLSLTAGEVAEVGASVSGHLLRDAASELRLIGSPLSLFVRGRLLPLPLGPLAAAPLRLAVSYQHELVAEPLGAGEAPGWSRGTLRLVAGQTLGRLELDGSVGLTLAQPDGSRLRPVGFELAAGASLRLLGGGESGAKLDLTAEAMTRSPVTSTLPSQQALLLGLLGRTASGYSAGVALGMGAVDGQAGVLAMARLRVSWGKAHRNPWAERNAAQPRTTPEFIWTLLGAIDPVLGADGCVWTDPKPQQPSRQWFCIGHPDPDDPRQILLPDKQRIAAGTHLWEFGKALWLNDGSKVAEIPLSARFRQKVWTYLAEHWPEGNAGPHPTAQPLCEGKIGQLRGLDLGSAMMVAHDEGGGAALLGAELLRDLQCNPDPSLREQASQTFNVLGLLGGRGPLRARPPLSNRLGDGSEGAAASRRVGGGAKDAGVAEHAVPPRLGPILPPKASKHLFTGELSKEGEAKGWHYEPTGEAQRGTYVLEPTRSPVDQHGVYEANVMIEGVKKKARSSFFPAHWTTEEVEKAIEEAYQDRSPLAKGPKHIFRGQCAKGVTIQMELDGRGTIATAYPLREGAK